MLARIEASAARLSPPARAGRSCTPKPLAHFKLREQINTTLEPVPLVRLIHTRKGEPRLAARKCKKSYIKLVGGDSVETSAGVYRWQSDWVVRLQRTVSVNSPYVDGAATSVISI